jgi:hypothetical protein
MSTVRLVLALALALSGAACKNKASAPESSGGDGKGGGKGDGKGGGKGDGKGGGKGDGKGGGPVVKATAVAAGDGVACALLDGGAVRCWGRSDVGELGAGRDPGQVTSAIGVPGVAGATALVVGGDPGDSGDLACVVAAGGKVWCWGYVGMFPEPTPADAPKPSEVPSLAGAVELSFGGGQGLARFPDGTVKGWGGNVFNALGLGVDVKVDDRALTAIPGVTDAIAIASGQNHGCAAHRDGTVTCWGYAGLKTNPTKVAGATDVVALAAKAGGEDTCALTKAGALTCWSGYKLEATPLAELSDVKAVSARTHFCAVKGDGSVWCWGTNGRGQLGDGTTKDATKPVQVTGVTDAVAVSAGSQSTCALRKTGQVVCWGYNRFGQLGDGTLIDRPTPVLVKHVNDKTPPVPAAPTAVQEHGVKQTFDGLPAGCTHAGKLDARFRDLTDGFPVVSAYALDESGKGLSYKVILANYQLDPARLWDPARGAQLRLSLRFAKLDLTKDRAPQPIAPGVYSMDTKQDQLVYPSIADRASDNLMLGSVTAEGLKAGEVELTKIGDGWVCGEARIETKDARFTGRFAAAVR